MEEFFHGFRYKKIETALGAIEIHDTNSVGFNGTAPDADSSIPRNEPFMVTNADTELRSKLGATGTLKRHLDILFKGTSAAVAICNIFEEGGTTDQTLANARGDQNSQTGIWALEGAESHGLPKPKILGTPEFTNFRVDNAANPVLGDQSLMANRMHAIHISSGPGTTDQEAHAFRNDFDDKRLIIGEPFAKHATGLVTLESMIAAIGVDMDKNVGFHASWGNQILPGALGMGRTIPYTLTNSDNRGTLIMANRMNIIARIQGGWRLWGDYAAANSTKDMFYCQTRVDDVLYEALARTVWDVISDPLIADKVTAVLDRYNAFLDTMTDNNILLGGRAEFKEDRNNKNILELGKFLVSIKKYSPPPITGIITEVEDDTSYLDVLVSDIISRGQYRSAA